MRTPTRQDLIRNIVFVIVVPGVVGGVIPGLISRYRSYDWGRWDELLGVAACALIVLGVVVLLDGVWRFARAGRGTPSPTAPTERTVVERPCRYGRNSTYMAVGAVLLGQVRLFFTWLRVASLAAFVLAVIALVTLYGEPTLRRTLGAEDDAYKSSVPGWFPRPP